VAVGATSGPLHRRITDNSGHWRSTSAAAQQLASAGITGHPTTRVLSRKAEARPDPPGLVPALRARSVRARLQHRLATVHQLLQRGLGSCRRPAENGGQLRDRSHQDGIQEAATRSRRPASSGSRPPRSTARAVNSSTTLGQPDPTCSVPKLVHTSARPSWPTPAEKRRRHACLGARRPGGAPRWAAGRWQAASRRPAGPLHPGVPGGSRRVPPPFSHRPIWGRLGGPYTG
jgi:hypothetical protein